MKVIDIENYRDLYKICEDGSVINSQGLKLSPHISKQGYVIQTLYKGGRKTQKKFRTHILVAKTFIPNPDNKPEVNHKDGNKLNNHVDNLGWVTSQENRDHAKLHKLYKQGDNHHNSILTTEKAKKIKVLLKEGIAKRKIARDFGVHQKTIINISNNKIWRDA